MNANATFFPKKRFTPDFLDAILTMQGGVDTIRPYVDKFITYFPRSHDFAERNPSKDFCGLYVM